MKRHPDLEPGDEAVCCFLIATALALAICFAVKSGEVYVRHWRSWNRSKNPVIFWTVLSVWILMCLGAYAAAITILIRQ